MPQWAILKKKKKINSYELYHLVVSRITLDANILLERRQKKDKNIKIYNGFEGYSKWDPGLEVWI